MTTMINIFSRLFGLVCPTSQLCFSEEIGRNMELFCTNPDNRVWPSRVRKPSILYEKIKDTVYYVQKNYRNYFLANNFLYCGYIVSITTAMNGR